MGPRRYLTIRRFILMVLVNPYATCTLWETTCCSRHAGASAQRGYSQTACFTGSCYPVRTGNRYSAGKTESKGEVRFSDPLTDHSQGYGRDEQQSLS